MMEKKVIWLSCAVILALVIASVPAAAEEYTTYRLKEIRTVYSKDPLPSSPLYHIDNVYADASGGYIKYTQFSDSTSGECKGTRQSFSVEWTFDKNVSVLSGKVGDRLCSVTGKITGDPDNNCLSGGDLRLTMASGVYGGPDYSAHLPQPFGNSLVYGYSEPGHKNAWMWNPQKYYSEDHTNPGPIGIYLESNSFRGGAFTLWTLIKPVNHEGYIQYIYEGVSGADSGGGTATAVTSSVTPIGSSGGGTTGGGSISGTGCTGTGTSVYVENRQMNPGQDVVIPIMMCNAKDIANMDLTVTYDSSVLKFKDAVKGSLNANSLFEFNNVGNQVRISFAQKAGFTGSGSIALLTFNVIGRIGQSSSIGVSVNGASTSTGGSVSIPVTNGQVTVGNNDPNNPGGRSGGATSLDALIALQMAVGKLPVDLTYDLTKDGKVTSDDAREILKLVVR